MTISQQLAAWSSGLRLEDVPADVQHIAKRCIIDTTGVIMAGTKIGPGRSTLATAQDLYGEGACQVPGADVSLSPAGAALASGTAAHALDFDDTSYTGIMHGSAVSLPVVLGLAQRFDRSGADILRDFIIAVEATYAIAMMCTTRQYYDGWWTSGTFGLPGATAAAGRAYGLSEDQMSQAIGIATVQTTGMKSMFGTDGKPYLAGRSAAVCVESAAAISHGLSGPHVAFEESRGYLNLINHGHADLSELDKLGKTWRLKDPGILFKQFPICSAAHAGAEMAHTLARQSDIKPADIKSVICEVPEVVEISLVYNEPATPQQSQFSMPFAVACILLNGTIEPKHLHEDVLNAPELRALMGKVEMRRDDSLAANPDTPEGARVTIKALDGRTASGLLLEPMGMPGNPMSDQHLGKKFLTCCEFIGADEIWAEDLLAKLWDVDQLISVRDLFQP